MRRSDAWKVGILTLPGVKKLFSLLSLGLLLTACGSPSQSTSAAPPTATAAPLPADPYAQTSVSTQARKPGTGGSSADPYNITLKFASGSDQRVVDAMSAAAARWQGVITQGLPEVNVNIPARACGSNAAYAGTVDDLLVFTGSQTIDGPGGVLAQSGPCSIRSASGLTVYSTLVFDSADLDSFAAQLPAIAMHELGHSLGIGSLWKTKNLTSGSGTTDPRYVGINGQREYAALGGNLGSVPEENEGGSGTAESHWREKSFGNELMTGYLNSGSNPMSRLTIGSLQDLGYSVDYARADAYSASTINSLNMHDSLDLHGREQVIEPRYVVY